MRRWLDQGSSAAVSEWHWAEQGLLVEGWMEGGMEPDPIPNPNQIPSHSDAAEACPIHSPGPVHPRDVLDVIMGGSVHAPS